MVDVVVIGGGIVGLATARALLQDGWQRVLVLEAEAGLAAHQTGHNSGVIHAGVYYRPGSLKARLCVAGRDALYQFCREEGVPYERCGKLVVATRPEQWARLTELEQRAVANGLRVVRCSPEIVREREPHVSAQAALLISDTGIVSFPAVARALASAVERQGGEVRTGSRVLCCRADAPGFALETTSGVIHCSNLVNCAGLQADRIARLCGVEPGVLIVPFRGEYYHLRPHARHLVKHLVYPVPDPRLPFLGVHFTRSIAGDVEAGPNAVLAFARHGYHHRVISAGDLGEMLRYPGFWRMARRYGKAGAWEFYRSLCTRAFVHSLRSLVPELTPSDLAPGGAGVRAQAIDPAGRLVDDFHILTRPGMVHVLNAPSPAATASLAIGRYIALSAAEAFRNGSSASPAHPIR